MNTLIQRIQSKWKKKSDNKGMTLVELVCAVAIFSLIGATVGGVMIVSAQTYQRGTNEIELQQEAQMAANQIGDLVIDATAAVTYKTDTGAVCMNEAEALASGATPGGNRTLEITKQDRFYKVMYYQATQEIWYEEYELFADGTTSLLGGGAQLLAENISTFTADVTDFATNGSLLLNLGLNKSDRSYASGYTITARNGLIAPTGADAAATITTESEITLEPSQAFDLEATVVGSGDTTVTWTMSGNLSSHTLLAINPATGKMQITIGTDETASEIMLMVKTNAKKEDGITPQAQQAVTVHIRRVTGVTLTAVLTSGTAMSAGATYRITANVTGTNLDKVAGTTYDTDYMPTKDITWGYLFTKDGKEVGGPDLPLENPIDYFEVIASEESGEAAACYTDVKLKKDMDYSLQFLVTAVAKHPEGTKTIEALGVSSTVNSNKTGVKYGHIYGSYLFFRSYYSYDGGKINRGTDESQGNFTALDSVKGLMTLAYGNANYQAYKEHRYREIIAIDGVTGERTYGPWTTWRVNPMNTSDYDINLRPDVTMSFDCQKDYEIQIRLSMYNRDTNTLVWPQADTPVSQYLIDAEIYHVSILFNSWSFGLSNVVSGGTMEAPLIVNKYGNSEVQGEFNYSNATSIKTDRIRDKLVYTMQKYVDGAWVDAGTSGSIYRNGDTCGYKFRDNGLYRILVGAHNVENKLYNPSTGSYSTQLRDYNLYDETTGEGIFYFQVQ